MLTTSENGRKTGKNPCFLTIREELIRLRKVKTGVVCVMFVSLVDRFLKFLYTVYKFVYTQQNIYIEGLELEPQNTYYSST